MFTDITPRPYSMHGVNELLDSVRRKSETCEEALECVCLFDDKAKQQQGPFREGVTTEVAA